MKLSSEKLAAFCAALAETGFVGKACHAVGVSRSLAYRWREENSDFAAAWDRAVKIGCTALEDEAQRRAFEGVDRPVFHGGQEVGSVKAYSDTLTMFLLKAHFPEKYRDRADAAKSGPSVEVVTGVPRPEDDPEDELEDGHGDDDTDLAGDLI